MSVNTVERLYDPARVQDFLQQKGRQQGRLMDREALTTGDSSKDFRFRVWVQALDLERLFEVDYRDPDQMLPIAHGALNMRDYCLRPVNGNDPSVLPSIEATRRAAFRDYSTSPLEVIGGMVMARATDDIYGQFPGTERDEQLKAVVDRKAVLISRVCEMAVLQIPLLAFGRPAPGS